MFRPAPALVVVALTVALTVALGCGEPAVTVPAGVYYCPMHPEVQQPQPGKCSKCGMDLVLKEGAPAGNGGTGSGPSSPY
jgi:heavy metal-binding protein